MQLQLFDTGPGDPPKIISDQKARDRETSKRYAATYPDRIKAKYQRRRNHYINYMRDWRKENPDYHKTWRKADRQKHPHKWLEIEHRRKALKRGAYVEEVNRRKVFERDNWTCGICSEPVDRTTKAPHPLSPSLDHVIPLARGGAHSYANVQCAHFYCNSIKSDRLEEAS